MRFSTILLSLALAVGAIAPGAAQQSFTLKVSSVLDPEHPVLVGARRMAEFAERESGGRLKITLFPSSQLGSQREVLQNAQAGVVDGVIDTMTTVSPFVPELAVAELPYLVKDEAAAFRLLDGPVVKEELGAKAAAAGFRLVNAIEVHFRNIYSRRPVRTIADLKGQKIRVIPSPSFVALFRAFGAAPTPMSYGEIYMSLQQGVIDAAENDNVTYLTSKHIEVARNLAITRHMMLANVLFLSERTWQRMPEDLRDVLRRAALAGREAAMADRAVRNPKALDAIRAAGANVTEPDLTPFIKLGRATYKETADKLGADLVNRIVEAAK